MNTAFVKRGAGFVSLILAGVVFILSLSARGVSSSNIILTATPSPTRIPLPAAPETLEEAQALMLSNGGCELPCFWGFQPGFTTAEEILSFAQPEGDYSNQEERYGIEYYFTRTHERDWTVTVLFTIENEVLSLIDVTLHEPSEWLPPETFGLPSLLIEMEVLPDAYFFISMAQRRIYLTLVYDEAGVVAQYPFQLRLRGSAVSPTGDEPYLFCPRLSLNDFINLWFQDGDGWKVAEEYLIGFTPDATSNPDWTVEQMTGLTVEAFIEQVITHPNRCIEMSSYHELLEQGYEF